MSRADALVKAREARRYYSTAKGRRERVASIEAELESVGAEVDRIREAGEVVPRQLRDRLRQLGRSRQRYLYGKSRDASQEAS